MMFATAHDAAAHERELERIRLYLAENFVQPGEVFPEDVLEAAQKQRDFDD